MHILGLKTQLLACTCHALCIGNLLHTLSSAERLAALLGRRHWEKPQRFVESADKKVRCDGVVDRGLQSSRQRPVYFACTSKSRSLANRLSAYTFRTLQ
jgi:hypothetical protein